MLCILTVRRLKPGSYDDFRTAWQPDNWPAPIGEAVIMRNVEYPDEVVSYAYFDGTIEDLDALRDDPEFLRGEEARLHRISEYEAEVLTNADLRGGGEGAAAG